jgi:hypothetical protein
LGYYEEHEAVIFTPNADLDLTARVKITNKEFGFFEIRMIIIFAEIGGNKCLLKSTGKIAKFVF